jgi:hypothetical protein
VRVSQAKSKASAVLSEKGPKTPSAEPNTPPEGSEGGLEGSKNLSEGGGEGSNMEIDPMHSAKRQRD